MADTKITALTALTAADPINDVIPIVDVSDTSMAASGTTKKISVNNLLSSSPTASGALTVTGLVTAGSATISGDLTVRTTGLTVNSSGVGVGVTAALGAGNIQIGAGKYLGYSATAYMTPEDNVQGARIKANNILVDATSESKFNIGGTLAMTLNTTGLGIANGNVILSTSGKGIDFAATASGSGTMTSELLNDYEEGTWTGTLTGGTTDPTVPVTATGRYTKVGRIVSVQIYFLNVITNGASGFIRVTGLPFANNSNVTSVAPVSIFSMGTFTGSPFASIGTNESFINFYSNNSNAANGDVTHNAGTTRFLTTTATYTVA